MAGDIKMEVCIRRIQMELIIIVFFLFYSFVIFMNIKKEQSQKKETER